MKLGDQIELLIKEVENTKNPEDEKAYHHICGSVAKLNTNATTLYELRATLDKVDNIQSLMVGYLPRNYLYDPYGSRTIADKNWNYKNLAREKKRLITTLKTLKSLVEAL